MGELVFGSENLNVDFINLNLPFQSLGQINRLATFLSDSLNDQDILFNRVIKNKNVLTRYSKIPYFADFTINSTKYSRSTVIRSLGSRV